jgi:hypothetical protein
MELALNEVKTQAKKLLKALRLDDELQLIMKLPLKKLSLSSLDELKLKHCLTIVSQQLGFDNWHHATDILSGNSKTNAPMIMGSFFYPKGSGGFINEWFADYQLAKNTLANKTKQKWLLPYKNQFIVVEKEYIALFNIDEKLMMLWLEIGHNMVDSYNSLAWDKLACEVIKNRSKGY